MVRMIISDDREQIERGMTESARERGQTDFWCPPRLPPAQKNFAAIRTPSNGRLSRRRIVRLKCPLSATSSHQTPVIQASALIAGAGLIGAFLAMKMATKFIGICP
jgi:hypothetical protein